MLIAINLVILVLAAVVALRSVVVVPAGHAFVVESFGSTTGRSARASRCSYRSSKRCDFVTRRPTECSTWIRRTTVTADNVVVRQTSIVRWKSDGRSTRDRPSASALRG
jgi:hypothetical protein